VHPHRIAPKPAIAIVGGESLLGKEVRELLEETEFGANVRLVASVEPEDEATFLTRGREEPILMTSIEAADLGTARIMVLAGSPESSVKAYAQLQNASPGPAVIDLTGGLEDLPEARLRAPMVEFAPNQTAARIQVIAQPAAIALALFLIRLQKSSTIRRSIAEIFEPVSERGQAGLDELQKQTVALLSFKPLSKAVFDAQVGFNMLSEYGEDSPHSLDSLEVKIDRHLATLLAGAGVTPMPSIRLIQAPVFHGYSMSVWVEFEKNPGTEAIVRALASDHIDVRAAGQEPPTNVGIAGQNGIIVGSIAPDRNQPLARWFWLVADNLRLTAENAVEVIRELLG
jgi:aspartate-semialdehyde dehydrogenase